MKSSTQACIRLGRTVLVHERQGCGERDERRNRGEEGGDGEAGARAAMGQGLANRPLSGRDKSHAERASSPHTIDGGGLPRGQAAWAIASAAHQRHQPARKRARAVQRRKVSSKTAWRPSPRPAYSGRSLPRTKTAAPGARARAKTSPPPLAPSGRGARQICCITRVLCTAPHIDAPVPMTKHSGAACSLAAGASAQGAA